MTFKRCELWERSAEQNLSRPGAHGAESTLMTICRLTTWIESLAECLEGSQVRGPTRMPVPGRAAGSTAARARLHASC